MTPTRFARAAARYGPFLTVIVIASLLTSPAANDHFQFWWVGHLIATGRSPYEPSAWAAALTYGPAAGAVAQNCVVPEAAACLWVYPPWTAWIFAPTGALDPQAGIALQRIMLTAALGIGAVLWVRLAQPIGMRSGALLVAFAASAPFVRDILTGHFEGVLLIGLALLAIGLRDRRTVMIAAGVVLLALKPHLFIALAVIILVWLIRERWYRALAGTAAVLGLLAAIGSASDPLAGPALVTRSFAKQNVASATAWGFASRIGDASGLFAAAFIVLIPIAAVVVLWWRPAPAGRPVTLVATGAAVSLAIAPYAQSYDAILLLPAVAIALTGLRPLTAIIAASTIVIVTWVAYALELAGDPRSFVGVLPAIALGVITLRAWARRTPSPEPAAARS